MTQDNLHISIGIDKVFMYIPVAHDGHGVYDDCTMKRHLPSKRSQYRALRVQGFSRLTARWIVQQGGSAA